MNLIQKYSKNLEIIAMIRTVAPIFFFNLVNFSFTIVDSIMVSRLGESSLGAVGQSGIYFNVVMMFFLGLLGIYTPLMSRVNLYKEKEIVKSRFIITIGICAIFATIIICILNFTTLFFDVFKQPQETTKIVNEYINIIKWSAIFTLLYSICVQTVYIIEKTKIIISTVIIGNVLNVILNWIFIYGNLNAPELGVAGAALATLITRIIMLILIVLFIYKTLPYKLLKVKGFLFEHEYLKNFFLKGIPKGITNVNDWFGSFLLVLFVGWGGVINIASNQVSDLISSLMYMLPQAFCVVITVKISKMAGQNIRSKSELKSGIIRLFKTIVPINIAFLLFCFLLLPVLISIFSLSSNAYNLAHDIMIVHIIFFLFYSFQFFFLAILDAFLDTLIPSVISVFTTYLFILPTAFFLAKSGVSPVMIWVVDGIGNILIATFFLFRIIKLMDTKKSAFETTNA